MGCGFSVRGTTSVLNDSLDNTRTLTEFAGAVPTTENLCMVVYDILQRGFTHAHLDKVRIEETMMNSFEYAGGSEIRR